MGNVLQARPKLQRLFVLRHVPTPGILGIEQHWIDEAVVGFAAEARRWRVLGIGGDGVLVGPAKPRGPGEQLFPACGGHDRLPWRSGFETADTLPGRERIASTKRRRQA